MTGSAVGRDAQADDVRARLDRLESIEEIRTLVARYALAADSRDIEAGIALFTEDTPVGPGVRGRAALRANWEKALGSRFSTTVHFVGNNLIELDPADPDAASGSTYCRAEHEFGDHWVIAMVRYADKYRRVGGRWLFYSRIIGYWYVVDVLERPTGEDKIRHRLIDLPFFPTQADVPRLWPTWEHFWSVRAGQRGDDPLPSGAR